MITLSFLWRKYIHSYNKLQNSKIPQTPGCNLVLVVQEVQGVQEAQEVLVVQVFQETQ